MDASDLNRAVDEIDLFLHAEVTVPRPLPITPSRASPTMIRALCLHDLDEAGQVGDPPCALKTPSVMTARLGFELGAPVERRRVVVLVPHHAPGLPSRTPS
jgi:hypothetical protein